MTIDSSTVLNRLREIRCPGRDEDIVTLGLVEEITVRDDVASVSLVLNTPGAPFEVEVGEKIESAIESLGLTAKLHSAVSPDHGFDLEPLPTVRNIIVVSSAKGGVGKTTVAVNLAAGLSERGAAVGILDGDLHGPNVPSLLPVNGSAEIRPGKGIEPPKSGAVKVMSLDLLNLDRDEPAALRGPLVNELFVQFVTDVLWGQLDYLIIDLPPGTGDGVLNALQTIRMSGAVIVSTPHRLSLADARRGVTLFRDFDVPILGLVENMDGYVCPNCSETHSVSHDDDSEDPCVELNIPSLGTLPIHPDFGRTTGRRPVVRDQSSPVQPAVNSVIGAMLDRLFLENVDIVAETRRQSGPARLSG